MPLDSPHAQPVWFRTLLACFAIFAGLGFVAGGALFGLAILKYYNQEHFHLWPTTTQVAPMNSLAEFAFGIGVSVAGNALIWGGVRELLQCYRRRR